VRRHGFAGSARVGLARLRRLGTRGARIVWSVVLVLSVALVAVLLTAPDRTSTEELIATNEAALTADNDADAAPAPAPAPAPTASGPARDAKGTTPATAKPSTAADWSMPAGSEIDAFGDSMMVGASHALRYYLPKIRMDARSNRRWAVVPSLVEGRGDSLRRAVVLAFGTNAGTDPKALRRTLDLLGPDRMVVLVTLHGPFSRIEQDNAALEALVADRPNVRLAQWDAALAGTSGQLQPDGIHPSLKGSHLYAKTVRAAFAELSQAHTGTKVVLKDLPMP
jgi:hypothetical protein